MLRRHHERVRAFRAQQERARINFLIIVAIFCASVKTGERQVWAHPRNQWWGRITILNIQEWPELMFRTNLIQFRPSLRSDVHRSWCIVGANFIALRERSEFGCETTSRGGLVNPGYFQVRCGLVCVSVNTTGADPVPIWIQYRINCMCEHGIKRIHLIPNYIHCNLGVYIRNTFLHTKSVTRLRLNMFRINGSV